MAAEKTVTQETKTETNRPVRETKTTTTTKERVEPKPRVIEETTVVEKED
ncbi:MAG TPA: hypothetical protein VGM92_06255 [Candidatus Kapabacteria bacterium]|jgi:hypothetical protein